MAGIELAKNLIKDGKNKGKVIATGVTSEHNRYMLIKLDTNGVLHQVDYGSDIKFDDVINLNDIVELQILDEYCAMWKVIGHARHD
jgi:hypothetical protein